jgi:hypothetical protein
MSKCYFSKLAMTNTSPCPTGALAVKDRYSYRENKKANLKRLASDLIRLDLIKLQQLL